MNVSHRSGWPACARALGLACGLVLLRGQLAAQGRPGLLPPIDPQQVQDQDSMTWSDYRPIPGVDWADPALKPRRGFGIALVAVDFPDQPFVITLPRRSDPFGNPQIDPVPRERVPQFYADFFLKPGEVNHGHTINGYWMEQSRGGFGITALDAFGPYRMPRHLWEYGLAEFGQNDFTPDGSHARARMEPDVDSLWAADRGDLKSQYDAILRIYAGYDETGVWQEFGEMKFNTKEDIPAEWGNPNAEKPRWVPTRYVPWTSWRAGAQQWGQSTMRQGENSGTITHELAHFAFHIPDLNNNPYAQPYRRAAVGPWDMLDRGSFNGPGGHHMRWVVPPTNGAAMPAGLMLKDRLVTKMVTDSEVLTLSREGLARSGLVVADVTAREVAPLPGSYAGVVVRLDGTEQHDRTPVEDPATHPLSSGTLGYDFYTLEVVQRLGYDSFTPDNGVLLAKNRDSLRGNNGGPNAFNSFIWVIDAHPEDRHMVDYVRPNGEKVLRTVADYRQLNDALFHAGLESGSQFEWEDAANRLHFYVIDLRRDTQGIRTYTLAVRSLDGAGPQARGVALGAVRGQDRTVRGPDSRLAFELRNAGRAGKPAAGTGSPQGSESTADVYRLTASIAGAGWSVRLGNALAAARIGQRTQVPVYVTAGEGAAPEATVTLRATSESDPKKSARARLKVVAGKMGR